MNVLLRVQDKQHADSYLRDLVESLNEIWQILSRLAGMAVDLVRWHIFSLAVKLCWQLEGWWFRPD